MQCWGCYLKDLAGEDISGMAGGRTILVPKQVAAQQRARGPARMPGAK
jgi:hypothetical protein